MWPFTGKKQPAVIHPIQTGESFCYVDGLCLAGDKAPQCRFYQESPDGRIDSRGCKMCAHWKRINRFADDSHHFDPTNICDCSEALQNEFTRLLDDTFGDPRFGTVKIFDEVKSHVQKQEERCQRIDSLVDQGLDLAKDLNKRFLDLQIENLALKDEIIGLRAENASLKETLNRSSHPVVEP